MSNPQKWYTCTPVRFGGDSAFFARDSGLLCKGFQKIGIPCKSIMPGPPMEHDCIEDLIRANFSNLEDPFWWSALDAYCVILYSWADPKYGKVASAIHKAGIKLVINTDTSGVLSLWSDGMLYIASRIHHFQLLKGPFIGSLFALLAILRSALPWTVDLPRLKHMAQADIIGAVTPLACERMKHYAEVFNRPDIASKFQIIHHPVSSYTQYNGFPKENRIVALGRWTQSDLVKRPHLLLEIITAFTSINLNYTFDIIGPYDEILGYGVSQLTPATQERIRLHGRLPNTEVSKILNRCKISLCTSSSESFHIATAEAICAGCSAVGLRSPHIAFLQYLSDEGIASLAASDQVNSYISAINCEVDLWENDKREPDAISQYWSKQLLAQSVAREILRIVEGNSNPPQN